MFADQRAATCAGRLFDFFATDTPWQRRLWSIGSILQLREVLEAAAFRRNGHFSDDTVAQLCKSAVRQIGPDSAIGSDELRDEIRKCLSNGALKDEHGERRLTHLTERAADGYLKRLAEAADADMDPDLAATLLASHLLDQAYSATSLHRWLTSIGRRSSGTSLPELIDSANKLSLSAEREYQAIVPMKRVPLHGMTTPE